MSKKYHDIVLDETLNDNAVADEVYATTQDEDLLKTSSEEVSPLYVPADLNSLAAKGYYFEDSSDIVFSSLDLFYKRAKISDSIDLGVDSGLFFIEQRNINRYEGNRYGASLFYENFSFRLGLNKYDDFSEIVPTIQYQDKYYEHNYLLEYTRQNALFYTYSLCSYEQRITADHFSVSDFINFGDDTDLWGNIEVNSFSNSNTEITAQFDWRLYYDRLFSPHFSYHTALEGWYTKNTSTNACYYSPSFTDTTILRIDPQYIFSKYFGVRAKLGVGHSFKEQTQPYKYGLKLFGNPTETLSYSVGCQNSNAVRLSYGPTYNYTECELNLGYKW
ncbi:hypothetical protein KKG72_11285 [bacterium]|nr:hypothetical protein [bacterium]MBU1994667.1 hypothetical protein [bacterium]